MPESVAAPAARGNDGGTIAASPAVAPAFGRRTVTPPTFLAHAKTGRTVLPEHSAMFHAALQKHGVASEYFELPTGRHGLGCGKGKEWTAWQQRGLAWMRARGLIGAEQP